MMEECADEPMIRQTGTEADTRPRTDIENNQSEDTLLQLDRLSDPLQHSNDPELDHRDEFRNVPPQAPAASASDPTQGGQGENINNRMFTLARTNFGALLALIGTTLFAIQGAVVTTIADDIDPFELNVLLVPVLTGGAICLMIVNGIAPPKTLRRYLWFLPSGLSLSGVNPLLVLAYRHTLYTDVTAITQVNIFLVGLLSWVIIREPYRFAHFLLALVALAGVFCISRPAFIFGNDEGDGRSEGPSNNLLGSAFAFGAACCIALTMVTVRKQSTLGIHPFQSVLFNTSIVALVNIILCTVIGEWVCPSTEVMLRVVGVGIIYLIAVAAFYSALARERAPKVSIINTFQVVVSFVLQIIFFGVVPPWTSWIGSLLIMIACIGTLVKRSTE